MSYNLLIAEVRERRFDEKSLDLISFSSLLRGESFMVISGVDEEISGVDKVLEVDIEVLDPLNCVLLFEEIRERFGDPEFILFPHSSFGMEVAPYLSGFFGFPIITDISRVKEDFFLKSFYSEKVFSELLFKKGPPFILTIRPSAFKDIERPEKRPERHKISLSKKDERRRFIEFISEEEKDIDISKATFLLSIGRGVGSKEEIPKYERLSEKLKAVLSASRPVIDKMWLPKSRQVGISGKTVKPKVYLAMGISGSFQHIQGMKDAECIIAINKDPQAPIFQYAHFGIVEDMHKIRDKLLQILEEK